MDDEPGHLGVNFSSIPLPRLKLKSHSTSWGLSFLARERGTAVRTSQLCCNNSTGERKQALRTMPSRVGPTRNDHF